MPSAVKIYGTDFGFLCQTDPNQIKETRPDSAVALRKWAGLLKSALGI